jgi:4-diphosphocytidyl-2-C-methyl-D-erythritol kinase
MIVFPNAKINLGLHITGKRNDGFHNLETIFYPIPWKDALEIIPSQDSIDVQFSQSGLTIDGSTSNNLCVKAYHLVKKKYPQLPPIQLHLLKQIPMGAGLGGGSADAAFTLNLLNKKFDLEIPNQLLEEMALELGSDCPFFLLNQPALATGRGEQLIPLKSKLNGLHLLLIYPGIHVSTAWAFQSLTLTNNRTRLDSIYELPIETWQEQLTNDFETPVFVKYPIIGSLKNQLIEAGAIYASMSGSGSSVFGIFEKEIPLPIDSNHLFRWMKLS